MTCKVISISLISLSILSFQEIHTQEQVNSTAFEPFDDYIFVIKAIKSLKKNYKMEDRMVSFLLLALGLGFVINWYSIVTLFSFGDLTKTLFKGLFRYVKVGLIAAFKLQPHINSQICTY